MKLKVTDFDGKPTVGRFTFRDAAGPRLSAAGQAARARTSSSRSRSIAHDGGTVLLPPGEFTVTYGRGPEYRLLAQKITVEPMTEQRRSRRRSR